jgi:cysteine desulfurase
MFPPLPKKKKMIYLDHAASTPTDAKVLSAMKPYFLHTFANPSSLYSLGVKAKNAIEESRKKIADILSAQPDTIYFTSGATESNNLAIIGSTWTAQSQGKHIITTKIEHDSVLRGVQELEKNCGFTVTYLDVDEHGLVNIDEFKKALRNDTILVSIMYANNEIGTIEPIAEIGREILKWRKNHNTVYPYFHCDAAQAPNYLDIQVEKLHVDLMTFNGSKIYGPKGVGVLYKRRSIKMQPQSYGGRQEKGVRAGTENVPGIVGFSKALEIVQKNREKKSIEMAKLRHYFWQKMQKQIPNIELNGPELKNIEKRLPSNLNIYFKDVEAEALVLYLDSYGIFVSAGSACSTESNEPSHVLKAIGCSDERANSSIRLSLGKDTTKKDIDEVMKYLPKIIAELRKIKIYE